MPSVIRCLYNSYLVSIAACLMLAVALTACGSGSTVTGTPTHQIIITSLSSNFQPPSQSNQPLMPKLTDPVMDPKQPGVVWFPQTGHILRGEFLDYWNRNGDLAQFGYPLTEEFVDESGPGNKPLTVQYFERNRFELHPENAGTPYEVLLGALGRDFQALEPPAPPLPAPTQYFKETGHNLSGAFKNYWNAHGELAVHGYPITEQFQEKSQTDSELYTVQYFERSRFELHPENAGSPHEVLLGLLGTQKAMQNGYFSGAYPRYGHAVDFSWVAGLMTRYAAYSCLLPECGCSILRYQGQNNDPRVQLEGEIWRRYQWKESPGLLGFLGKYFTVFGHLASPGEEDNHCVYDHAAQVYVVHSVHESVVP